jgi:hypothetical protein
MPRSPKNLGHSRGQTFSFNNIRQERTFPTQEIWVVLVALFLASGFWVTFAKPFYGLIRRLSRAANAELVSKEGDHPGFGLSSWALGVVVSKMQCKH